MLTLTAGGNVLTFPGLSCTSSSRAFICACHALMYSYANFDSGLSTYKIQHVQSVLPKCIMTKTLVFSRSCLAPRTITHADVGRVSRHLMQHKSKRWICSVRRLDSGLANQYWISVAVGAVSLATQPNTTTLVV